MFCGKIRRKKRYFGPLKNDTADARPSYGPPFSFGRFAGRPISGPKKVHIEPLAIVRYSLDRTRAAGGFDIPLEPNRFL